MRGKKNKEEREREREESDIPTERKKRKRRRRRRRNLSGGCLSDWKWYPTDWPPPSSSSWSFALKNSVRARTHFSIPSRVFIEEQRGGDDYPKTPDKPNLKKWWSFLLNYGNIAPSRTIRYALVSSECTCERNRGNLHWRARRERERVCVCVKRHVSCGIDDGNPEME